MRALFFMLYVTRGKDPRLTAGKTAGTSEKTMHDTSERR
jgi:hypothetical protein